ncbi:MAG: stage II sporulation protein M [Candidatus Pacearchaeota archaeon]|nr:stage II sporulation protein M [Candidatus Pacearchaeota archaeon]
MKSKKKNLLWKESLGYLRETKKYIYFIFLLFLVSGLIGFIFKENFKVFDSIIAELAGKTEGLGLFELMGFIFWNNLGSSFLAMISGVFLGISAVGSALFNGVLLGYVYSKASEIAGFGIIWRLVPHGVFELPAIFIALGLGVKLGMFIFTKERKKEFIRRLRGSVNVFITIIIPLLLIAAIIEGLLIVFIG